MKSLFIKITGLVLIMFALSSCFDMDNEEYRSQYSSWGVVTDVESSSYEFKALLDGGMTLIAETVDVSYDADTMDRVRIFFYLNDESELGDDSIYVEVFALVVSSIKDVVTYSCSDSLSVDTFGIDPICVNDETVWQSNNLLNIPFAIDMSYNYDVEHSINLVYFPDSVYDDNGTVYLELRHDANDDSEEMVVDGFYSFDMESISPFENISDSVPYVIVINNDGFSSGLSELEGYFYAY